MNHITQLFACSTTILRRCVSRFQSRILSKRGLTASGKLCLRSLRCASRPPFPSGGKLDYNVSHYIVSHDVVHEITPMVPIAQIALTGVDKGLPAEIIKDYKGITVYRRSGSTSSGPFSKQEFTVVDFKLGVTCSQVHVHDRSRCPQASNSSLENIGPAPSCTCNSSQML
jgi:hypothetical protein